MNEEDKKIIIQQLNLRIGHDIYDLTEAGIVEYELHSKKDFIETCLNAANNEVPSDLSAVIKKAKVDSRTIQELKEKNLDFQKRVSLFMENADPLRGELYKRFEDINKLEQVLAYLKSFEQIDEISRQMKQCSDDEQLVQLYGDLKKLCVEYKNGHRGAYVKEYSHFWHNELKERFSKNYEDILVQLKWPFISGSEHSPPSKEIASKFTILTYNLFLIQEPEDLKDNTVNGDFSQEKDPCLPVRILLRPLKKRFTFHFTGSRQTARIDRPEWFLTQTLTWIKDHQLFVKNLIQPIADKLQMKLRCVDEFNNGLISLAAERLHTVLALYNTPSKGVVDMDAAFAHAVDETLGFHREVIPLTNKEGDGVLSVLTKAETFIRWLAVEKKYALAKMDETLDNEQWTEPVGAGVGAAVGDLVWVPRGADWFIALLTTIENRYVVLPQPGHRLQFLELQLELIEEWRVRLTQLMSAAVESLTAGSFVRAPSPHALTAVANAAHHTRTALLQRAHSLHYLQLHYYRRQFQQFTHQHHRDEESESSSSSESDDDDDDSDDDTLSLKEVEDRAKKMALLEMCKNSELVNDMSNYDQNLLSPYHGPMQIANLAVTDPLPEDAADTEAAGVFAEAPALLAHLRDAGLRALAEHIMFEFKAGMHEYKKQKWHSMLVVEEIGLTVSSPLCRPLSGLCSRMACASARLAPTLSSRLRTHLAAAVDQYMFEEIVLETWFNTGGTLQFTHDVQRNIVPAFAPPNKTAKSLSQLPKLQEACRILNLDYDDARRFRSVLAKRLPTIAETMAAYEVKYCEPNEILQILNQRTDLTDTNSPTSVMELF